MKINDVEIEDTFAEGFGMRYARLIVTALNRRWLDAAIRTTTGYATSVIGCDAEAGLECYLSAEQTFDGRPGAALLLFAFSTDALQKAITNRVGQCLMTCPTTAVFDGLAADQVYPDDLESFKPAAIGMGQQVRYFGDGYQKSKIVNQRRLWRVPVMDGEFIVEDTIGVAKGVAGGNFLIVGRDQPRTLAAAEAAIDAINTIAQVITPFPGGVVRSGSKVGSKYSNLVASTYDAFCPTLRGRVETRLPDQAGCVYEIVIDGMSHDAVASAINAGIVAACQHQPIRISAGNYGGKLGKHHFLLHSLMQDRA